MVRLIEVFRPAAERPNGLLEAISSLVQAATRRARGYRTKQNLTAIVYLAAGKLNFNPAT